MLNRHHMEGYDAPQMTRYYRNRIIFCRFLSGTETLVSFAISVSVFSCCSNASGSDFTGSLNVLVLAACHCLKEKCSNRAIDAR